MLPVFAVWTVIFIFASEPMVRFLFGFEPAAPGETFYIEAWGPWIATTLLWLAPVVAGLVLGVLGAVKGAGKLAWWAVAVHGALFLFFTVPNVVERLTTL